MPRPNNRSYSNNSNSNRKGGYSKANKSKDARAKKFGNSNIKMVGFGYAFLDEADASYDFKCRIKLKSDDNGLMNVFDDSKESEYTPEEAVALLSKALLDGRAINICFFPKDDGEWTGNVRIDVNGLEDESDEDEPVQKKTTKVKSKGTSVKAKPKYEIPEEDADDDDEITEDDEDDTDEIPY